MPRGLQPYAERGQPGQSRQPGEEAVQPVFLPELFFQPLVTSRIFLESKQLLFAKVSLQGGCVCICCRLCFVKCRNAQPEPCLCLKNDGTISGLPHQTLPLSALIVTMCGKALLCIQSCQLSEDGDHVRITTLHPSVPGMNS